MKEFVLAEFLFEISEFEKGFALLESLGDDFLLVHIRDEWERSEDLPETYKRVTGRINSMTASIIKLQEPDLAGKMRISYIPDDLKNKYRR